MPKTEFAGRLRKCYACGRLTGINAYLELKKEGSRKALRIYLCRAHFNMMIDKLIVEVKSGRKGLYVAEVQ